MTTVALKGTPEPGSYLAGDRVLYHVEEVLEDRALLEDCRTGELVDISLDELGSLRLVKRDDAPQEESRGTGGQGEESESPDRAEDQSEEPGGNGETAADG